MDSVPRLWIGCDCTGDSNMVLVDLELVVRVSKRFVLHSVARRHHGLGVKVQAAVRHSPIPAGTQGWQEVVSDTDFAAVVVVPVDMADWLTLAHTPVA